MSRKPLLAAVALVISVYALPHNNRAFAVPEKAAAVSSGTATQATIPAAPSNLTVTAVTSGSVDLAWTDNSSDEDGFKIEWCTGANCSDFQLLATMPAGVNSITQWSLNKNRTYKYRVCAYNSAGDSGYTNIVSATTLR
jgi:hypothetical protein